LILFDVFITSTNTSIALECKETFLPFCGVLSVDNELKILLMFGTYIGNVSNKVLSW